MIVAAQAAMNRHHGADSRCSCRLRGTAHCTHGSARDGATALAPWWTGFHADGSVLLPLLLLLLLHLISFPRDAVHEVRPHVIASTPGVAPQQRERGAKSTTATPLLATPVVAPGIMPGRWGLLSAAALLAAWAFASSAGAEQRTTQEQQQQQVGPSRLLPNQRRLQRASWQAPPDATQRQRQ